MTKAVTHIGAVVFDPAKRRFRGELHLTDARKIYVSAAGYPSWDHRRIAAALVARAERRVIREVQHAGA